MPTFWVPYHFTVDGSEYRRPAVGAAYERHTINVLHEITASETGRCLFAAMRAAHKDLTIRPYTKTKKYHSHSARVNATARPDNYLHATPKDQPIYQGGDDDPSTPADERLAHLKDETALSTAALVGGPGPGSGIRRPSSGRTART